MKNILLTMLIFTATLAPCAATPAADAATLAAGADTLAAGPRLRERVQVQRLDNGLTVLYVRRANAPVFAAVISVNVGSSDEGPGYRGLAHLFEHMAFKGTPWIGTRDYEKEKPLLKAIEETAAQINEEQNRRVPNQERLEALNAELKGREKAEAPLVVKDEFDAIYKSLGGQDLNATTGNDFTTYFVEVPSNAFEVWACLESQRVLNPVLREFYQERDVVAEERRMRTDNNPGGKLLEQFFATALIAHPYRTPPIGWESDIRNLTMGRARAFYKDHYVASNMTIAIVGDVNIEQAKGVVERYFARLPKAPRPQRAATREPEPAGPRRAFVRFDANPQVVLGWLKPTLPHRDDLALEILSRILDGGRASRLQKSLVQEKQLAASLWVWSSAPGEKYDNLFMVSAAPQHPHNADEVEAGILSEIAKTRDELVTDREIQRVRNQISAESIRKLASNLGLARELAYYANLTDDPFYADQRLEELLKVTPADVRNAARTYLTPERMTVVTLAKE